MATANTRILFGSCSSQTHPQPLWDQILRLSPDAFVWGGDVVYHDSGCGPECFRPASLAEMEANFAAQRAEPGYAALRASGVPIFGTWDDHDYGINDGDRTWVHRNVSRELFLDFLDVPADSVRRTQAGVYASHDVAHPSGVGTVKVLLLDNRYARDPWDGPVGVGDFLGDEQWAWFESELSTSTADVHLIVSGLQVLPEFRYAGESWSRFPASRERLLDTLLRLRVRSPVLLSGDVHYGELMEASCSVARGEAEAEQQHWQRQRQRQRQRQQDDEVASARLVEITSSGMTHGWAYKFVEPASLAAANGGWSPARFGTLEGSMQRALGWVVMHWFQRSQPFRYQMRSGDGTPQYMLGLNFGEVRIDWGARSLAVALRDSRGATRHAATFALDALGTANQSRAAAEAGSAEPQWRCVGHRGDVDQRHAKARFALSMLVLLGTVLGAPAIAVCVVCRALCAAAWRRWRRHDATAGAAKKRI